MHAPNYGLPTTLTNTNSKHATHWHEQKGRFGWIRSLYSRRYWHSRTCFGLILLSLGCLAFISDLNYSWSQSVFPLQPQAGSKVSNTVVESKMGDTGQGGTSKFPPLYEEWYEYERLLPQHNVSLPFPEGGNGLYFYPANHVWGLGFNNVLQEVLFLSHLAYISNRSFVFDPYTWEADRSKSYANYNGKLIPARVPMNALISGPAVGGSFGTGDEVPRAVIHEYWDKVCPHPTVISSDEVNEPLGNANAEVMMRVWSEKLRGMPDRCVQVDAFSSQIFSFYVFGDGNRVLPFFEEFIRSPIITRFAWSPVVNTALTANVHLLVPKSSFAQNISTSFDISDASIPIPGLLAIHVRRGDFDEHCKRLAGWGSDIQGWYKHPELPDRFIVPNGAFEDPRKIEEHYNLHCWPTMEQMTARIAEVRETPEAVGLKSVYILTNGPREWVAELKGMIKGMGGWELVHSSRDLQMTPEQKYIGQAIDMAISSRAQMFIGNGFSSLSANVVLLRLSRNYAPRSNRIW